MGFDGCRMEEWHHLCQNNVNIPALTYILKKLPVSKNRIKKYKKQKQNTRGPEALSVAGLVMHNRDRLFPEPIRIQCFK